MAPCKWSLIALLGGLLLIGLPNGGKLEAPTEETTTSSVKECRVHIEKALEQYWDHKEPENSNNLPDQTENINTQIIDDDDDDDDDDDVVPGDSDIKDQTDVDEDDEDDDDEEENIEKAESESDETDNEKNDDDKDDDDEDDEDDEDNEVKASESTTDAPENQDTEEDDNKDETDDDDDDEETDENKDMENSDNEILNDAGKSVLEENEDNAEKSETIKENEDEDDDDINDDDDDDDIGVSEQKDANESSLEGDEEEEEDEEDEEDEDKSNIGETTTKDSTTREADEDSKSKNKEETESDKVTGEADSASARVVSELPENKPSIEQSETPKVPEKTIPVTTAAQEQEETSEDDEDEDQPSESEDKDDDTIENIYEEDDDESSSTLTFRNRNHIDVILGLDEIGTDYEKEEDKLAQSIFKEIKKIQLTNIKPIEMLYKYTDSTTRVLGDAEIFNKPMLLFLGPWNSGKTTILNYILGNERVPTALKTGTGVTDVDFTLVTYGDQKQVISGTELAADWRYAGLQKFGQGFLDHFRSVQVPSTLLKKITIVDTPGILENKKNTERGYAFNDAFQWFIDRADAIYVVLDPTKVDIGGELGSVLDQLKGREVRFVLNKADTIRRSDLMRVVGQLFWNLSPLMSSTEAPIIYAVSLTTKPYHPSAPSRFLADQENNFFYDMKDTLNKRIENRILYARRHAVRVRNHAKMIDCYLATYYRHKSIFSSKKNVAKLITENPRDYNIFEGIGTMTNISRYDLPDPNTYKEFFKLHPLYDFKPLASTCSYFRGCPMEKLDAAISHDIPELFAKYKKAKGSSNAVKQEGR